MNYAIAALPVLPFIIWIGVVTVRHRRRMREIQRLSDWRAHVKDQP